MKVEKMTIEELGREYEKHVALQQFFIDKCEKEIKEAKKAGDGKAVKELSLNLYKFKEIKNELMETANKLKNYYKGDEKSDRI